MFVRCCFKGGVLDDRFKSMPRHSSASLEILVVGVVSRRFLLLEPVAVNPISSR